MRRRKKASLVYSDIYTVFGADVDDIGTKGVSVV